MFYVFYIRKLGKYSHSPLRSEFCLNAILQMRSLREDENAHVAQGKMEPEFEHKVLASESVSYLHIFFLRVIHILET